MMIQKFRIRLVLAIVFCLLLGCVRAIAADTLKVSSPSGKITVRVWMEKQLTYNVSFEDKLIVAPSYIDLLLNNGRGLSVANRIKSSSLKKVTSQIISPVPEKRKVIPDVYTNLNIDFGQPFKVDFRVYDDGVAYRVSTAFKDSVIVNDEVAEFVFPGNASAYFPEIVANPDRTDDLFHCSWEDNYAFKKLAEFPLTSLTYSPLLVVPEAGPKLAITESDLEDYPGLFLKGTGSSKMKAVFARYALEEKVNQGLYSNVKVTKRADYLARTKGTRSYPWRILIVSEHDKDLPSNDIVYRLAAPSRVPDASWVQPGNLTEEWIIDLNIYNVPFKAGRNTATYKYYIDFASKFGIKYVMMDAGWSDNDDLMKVIPEISMDTLIAYAKSKNVKLAMWTLALTLDRQLDTALAQFNKWGVDFIMTDFIERDDQKVVNFHHKIAKACADHKIMIMYHGSYPPKGFNRTYPNAVAREAVLGSEYNAWSEKVTPPHDVLLPFTRMLAGPMDYEPGILNNAVKGNFHAVQRDVMSAGTRVHQLAMLAIYDSPMQFFSGSPSQGLEHPEYMQLLGSIPTTWDTTIIIDAKVGEYIVTARNKGTSWFVGGMTDWTAREIVLKADFLAEGKYKATICKDGANADRHAADYTIETIDVAKNQEIKIPLAPGGGFLVKFEKQ